MCDAVSLPLINQADVACCSAFRRFNLSFSSAPSTAGAAPGAPTAAWLWPCPRPASAMQYTTQPPSSAAQKKGVRRERHQIEGCLAHGRSTRTTNKEGAHASLISLIPTRSGVVQPLLLDGVHNHRLGDHLPCNRKRPYGCSVCRRGACCAGRVHHSSVCGLLCCEQRTTCAQPTRCRTADDCTEQQERQEEEQPWSGKARHGRRESDN